MRDMAKDFLSLIAADRSIIILGSSCHRPILGHNFTRVPTADPTVWEDRHARSPWTFTSTVERLRTAISYIVSLYYADRDCGSQNSIARCRTFFGEDFVTFCDRQSDKQQQLRCKSVQRRAARIQPTVNGALGQGERKKNRVLGNQRAEDDAR